MIGCREERSWAPPAISQLRRQLEAATNELCSRLIHRDRASGCYPHDSPVAELRSQRHSPIHFAVEHFDAGMAIPILHDAELLAREFQPVPKNLQRRFVCWHSYLLARIRAEEMASVQLGQQSQVFIGVFPKRLPSLLLRIGDDPATAR